ncbi:hypothetical protein LshimejAT787_1302070 [Lyophyllum shimeji]|uniref:Uncharacterized protein n=1 Tax=Lyophyllum shimeji TaxID=47721 RepID=A0A9P3PY62_LYOSH|nr:hypothetical protein LshimejAT787_0600550 [Lyophyllum shimeji]GLB43306.1 hypothetical protein LshimejAT787_1302070 [Lyophyllum shimeji]
MTRNSFSTARLIFATSCNAISGYAPILPSPYSDSLTPLQHTGERDTRGPADFSDAAGGVRHDDGDADDDDEDGDGDDFVPSAKKGGAGRNNDDEDYKPSARVITEHKNRPSISNERAAADSARSSLTLPTSPPIPQYDHQHPMSSDRLHPLHHQRPYEDQ